MGWYVYILQCGDGSFYTGSTTDVTRRLREHRSGKGARYTRSRPPVMLVYTEEAPNRSAAQRREAAIKQMTHREKRNLLETENTPMRRTDRELTAEQAWDIVDGCDDCIVSMTETDGAPYAVPLNFARDGAHLYFHSAVVGHKSDCLRQHSRVCVVCVAEGREIDQPKLTTRYASAILRGTASEVTDTVEKRRALRLLCQRLAPQNPMGQSDFAGCLDRTAVWRIDVDSITGKANRAPTD